MRVHLFQKGMYGFDYPNPAKEALGIPEGLHAMEGFVKEMNERCGARSVEATALLPK